jgi:hypothetical protein
MAWLGNHLASKVVENKRWRAMYRGGFVVLFFLGVVGTWIFEWRSDASHAQEVYENKDAISRLNARLQATQLQSANDMGYLKGRFDDAASRPQPDAAQLCRSIIASNTEVVRAQAKKETTTELKKEATQIAQEMRVFESQYKQRSNSLSYSPISPPNATRAQEIEAFDKRVLADQQLHEQERLEFGNRFLARARALRDEMILKIGYDPVGTGIARSQLIAFDGILAGPNPISDAADYLELLASKLPETSR